EARESSFRKRRAGTPSAKATRSKLWMAAASVAAREYICLPRWAPSLRVCRPRQREHLRTAARAPPASHRDFPRRRSATRESKKLHRLLLLRAPRQRELADRRRLASRQNPACAWHWVALVSH